MLLALVVRALVAAIAGFVPVAGGTSPLVVNGDFEGKIEKDGVPSGWTLEVGAQNGAAEPLSKVEVDLKEKHKGRGSLHFSGNDRTRVWRSARQKLPVRPGGTYKLKLFAKTEKVHGEMVAGTSIAQFTNCHVALALTDDGGKDVALEFARPPIPTSKWQPLSIQLVAPESAREAQLVVFLSMSGDFWVDDIELTIEGGKELPPEETVLDEGFDKIDKLPAEWKEEVGANNGAGTKRSTIAIDAKEGAPGSPHSLHFTGDAQTIQWYDVSRTFDVKPGDALRLSALVKGKDIRKEGIQFANFHLWLAFRDANGKELGSPLIAAGGMGTFDWKKTEAHGVAPEGATQVQLGVFLSMSGDAWIDQVALVKRSGSTPAYGGWLTLESKHVIVRYPKELATAAQIQAYAQRLDAAFESVRKTLDVVYDEKITVYLYRDGEQGKQLTGRELDFAAPEDRALHQTMRSTISHEMTHVIALKMGYAQTRLLGEGLGVWLDGASAKDHHERAAKLERDDKLPALDALLDDFRSQEGVSYPAAGSFCGYVIETFGMPAFKRLYVMTDPRSGAKEALGKTLEDVDHDWRVFLSEKH